MDAVDRSFVDLDNIDQRKIVILQAVWRGTVVRKWMKSLRGSFQEICAEIDRKQANNIHWRNRSLCYPSFIKTQHTKTSKINHDCNEMERSEREIHKACSHCQTFDSEQRKDIKECTHCRTSDSKQGTVCDRYIDPHRDAMVPSKLNGDDSLVVNSASNKKTDDWSAETVTMTTECVENSANNPVTLSCHGEETFPESAVNLTCNVQDRVLTSPELRGDNEQMEDNSEQQRSQHTEAEQYPSDRVELLKLRKNIAMELLWVQQAINSRKNYLHLKAGME